MIFGCEGFHLGHYEMMGSPAEGDVNKHRVGSAAAPCRTVSAKTPIAERRKKKQCADNKNRNDKHPDVERVTYSACQNPTGDSGQREKNPHLHGANAAFRTVAINPGNDLRQ